MLDRETFNLEPGNIRWRFYSTERFGQFDIAVPADEDLNADAAAIAHLEAALGDIDALVDLALPKAEEGWTARYKSELRPRDAWSLIRLFAHTDGRLVLSLNEGEFDTYFLWDVTLVDGQAISVEHRVWGGTSG